MGKGARVGKRVIIEREDDEEGRCRIGSVKRERRRSACGAVGRAGVGLCINNLRTFADAGADADGVVVVVVAAAALAQRCDNYYPG